MAYPLYQVDAFAEGVFQGYKKYPVTGSANSLLAPYWGQRLNKTRMTGLQISHRPGRIDCELDGDRVRMRGQARTYLRGFVEWTS